MNGWFAGAARQFVSNLIPLAWIFRSVPFGVQLGPFAWFFFAFSYHVSKFDPDITCTVKVIALWNSPQNSAHSPTYWPSVPVFNVSSNVLVRPGTTSRLKKNAGMKNEWMTSFVPSPETSSKWMSRPVGRYSVGPTSWLFSFSVTTGFPFSR